MTYTQEETDFGNQNPVLGAEYKAASDSVQRFLEHWQEEHADKIASDIMKPIIDEVQSKVGDALRDWLISDVEYNAASKMQDMVESSVKALIGGEKWANRKYITYPGCRGEKVRETLARLYSDEIKDGRIADLEEQVKRYEENARFNRSY